MGILQFTAFATQVENVTLVVHFDDIRACLSQLRDGIITTTFISILLEDCMQAVPSEFLSIDRKERVNKPFFDLDLRAPEERTCDFDGVVIEFSPERAMVQAAKLLDLDLLDHIILTGSRWVSLKERGLGFS